MISARKLTANRLNAQRSTGPRTEQGKAIASANATTHGLTARSSVLPGEDASAYRALADALRRDLQPAGISQREIVDHITQLTWKLRRIPLIESAMVQREIDREHEQQQRSASRRRSNQESSPEPIPAIDPIKLLAREFAGGTDNGYARLELYRLRLERSLFAAHRELRKLREETAGEEVDDRTSPRDTGLRPVRNAQSIQSLSRDQSTPHGPEARVTGEGTQNRIGQNKPTVSPDRSPGHDLAFAISASSTLPAARHRLKMGASQRSLQASQERTLP